MDLQLIAMTTLTDALERYNAAYSRYVEYMPIVHNNHLLFIQQYGLRPGNLVKKGMREMANIHREMIKIQKEVVRSNYALRIEHLKSGNAASSNKSKYTKPKP